MISGLESRLQPVFRSIAIIQQPEGDGQRVVERRIDARGFERGADPVRRVELGRLDEAREAAQVGRLGIDADGRRLGIGANELERLAACPSDPLAVMVTPITRGSGEGLRVPAGS